MGYTHYWERTNKLNEKKFEEFSDKVQKIVDHIDKDGPIGGVWYDDREIKLVGNNEEFPTITKNKVIFNGTNGESCENFCVLNDSGELIDKFSFCKTKGLPYDIAVTAALVALKHTFPYAVNIASDGQIKEWKDGLKLYNVSNEEEIKEDTLESWLKEEG